jgi:hypothetical protein
MQHVDGWTDEETRHFLYPLFSCTLSKEQMVIHEKLSCSRPKGCRQLVSRIGLNSTPVDIQTENKVKKKWILKSVCEGSETIVVNLLESTRSYEIKICQLVM